MLLKRKINEEAFEVITANTKDEITWEVADLTYFILSYIVKNNVSIEDVINHLEARTK